MHGRTHSPMDQCHQDVNIHHKNLHLPTKILYSCVTQVSEIGGLWMILVDGFTEIWGNIRTLLLRDLNRNINNKFIKIYIFKWAKQED